MEIQWSGMTHRGRFRSNNEDAFLALKFNLQELSLLGKIGATSLDNGDCIFAVSDGMGGANAGEFASRIAVEMLRDLLPQFYRSDLEIGGHEGILTELFGRINERMQYMSRSYEECKGMGATLSLGWVTTGYLYFAHVGDSRIYHLPAGKQRRQLTHDDTHAGWLFRQGQINEREARNHPGKNGLLKVLGGKNSKVIPQTGMERFAPGDYFVFCTDGINDGLWDRALDDLVREPPKRLEDMQPAERLVKEAMSESGRDNLTSVVVQICSG